MRVKGRNTDSKAASTLLYAPPLSLFTCNSLSPILAYWKWVDNRELGHVMKSNSRKNYDGHTWMKQDKGNLIRRDSILTFQATFTGLLLKSTYEREAHIIFHAWEEAEWTETLKVEESHSKIPLCFSGKPEEKINNSVGGREEFR